MLHTYSLATPEVHDFVCFSPSLVMSVNNDLDLIKEEEKEDINKKKMVMATKRRFIMVGTIIFKLA